MGKYASYFFELEFGLSCVCVCLFVVNINYIEMTILNVSERTIQWH